MKLLVTDIGGNRQVRVCGNINRYARHRNETTEPAYYARKFRYGSRRENRVNTHS